MNYAQMAKALDHYPVYITDDAQLGSGDEENNFTSMDDEIKNLYAFEHGAVSMTEFLIRSGTMLTTVSMCVIR